MNITNRDELVKVVRAVGLEIAERAEDLVGDSNTIADFDIWLRFPQGAGEMPTIELSRTHVSERVIEVICGK